MIIISVTSHERERSCTDFVSLPTGGFQQGSTRNASRESQVSEPASELSSLTMANTTVRGALAIHGQNPQVLIFSELREIIVLILTSS